MILENQHGTWIYMFVWSRGQMIGDSLQNHSLLPYMQEEAHIKIK